MINVNCLEGIACPRCGNDSKIVIAVSSLAEVTDDGGETFGDMEWDGDSYTKCPKCGCQGKLREFRLPDDHDAFNPIREE
jgi:hypothetical protein